MFLFHNEEFKIHYQKKEEGKLNNDGNSYLLHLNSWFIKKAPF
tara:strand:+ start:951 stop:1079 length:129 start_codon:yes stop_codon:yes gene_type:complete